MPHQLGVAQLAKFNRIKIDHLNLSSLNQLESVSDYMLCLAANHQSPALTIMGYYYTFRITLTELQMMFHHPVRALDCKVLKVTKRNADQFAEMIINKHKCTPFKHFTAYSSVFGRKHMAMFKKTGLLKHRLQTIDRWLEYTL